MQKTASPTAPAQPVFGPRLIAGLTGVFIAAIMAGLNNRVPALCVPDIRGAHGLGANAASWLDTVYLVGEITGSTVCRLVRYHPIAAPLSTGVNLRRHAARMATALCPVATVHALNARFARCRRWRPDPDTDDGSAAVPAVSDPPARLGAIRHDRHPHTQSGGVAGGRVDRSVVRLAMGLLANRTAGYAQLGAMCLGPPSGSATP